MKKEWNPDVELIKLQALHHLRMQRRTWHGSVLDPYSKELTELRERGASLAELCIFLKSHRVDVNRSTVCRWLHKNNAVVRDSDVVKEG